MNTYICSTLEVLVYFFISGKELVFFYDIDVNALYIVSITVLIF